MIGNSNRRISLISLRFSQYGPNHPFWQTGHPFLHEYSARQFLGQKLLHWSVPLDVRIQAEKKLNVGVHNDLLDGFE